MAHRGSLWPKHFLSGDHDRNLTVDQYRKALETDIKIHSASGEWRILSYYYSSEDQCYVLDIEEKNSTYEEGWNAVLFNLVEGTNYKRSDGNKEFKKGWDACKKARNPDWI